jgi:HEAT repeat protein
VAGLRRVATMLLIGLLPVAAGCRREEPPPDVGKQVERLVADAEEDHYKALKNLQSLGAGGAAAVPELRALLARTTDDDLRAEIAKTLGRMGPAAAAAVPDLVKLLERKAMWPRYCAVEALGRMGQAAVPVLPKIVPLTRDRDRDVAGAAVEAVQRLRRAEPRK